MRLDRLGEVRVGLLKQEGHASAHLYAPTSPCKRPLEIFRIIKFVVICDGVPSIV